MKFLIQVILVFSVYTVPTSDTIPLPDVLKKIDSLSVGDTFSQLNKSIKQYQRRVDSLQSLPVIDKREVYIATRDLSMAQASLYLWIAKTSPKKTSRALKTAEGFKRKTLIYSRKADSIRVAQTPDVPQRVYIRRCLTSPID
jgi:hypothetical protein